MNRLKKEEEDLKKKYEEIKEKYQYLILDNIELKEKYEKEKQNHNKLNMSTISANTSMVGYQVSPEEYEEYDNLRKYKDENEALMMQLRSNLEAQNLEIKELKQKIQKLQKKKKK